MSTIIKYTFSDVEKIKNSNELNAEDKKLALQ